LGKLQKSDVEILKSIIKDLRTELDEIKQNKVLLKLQSNAAVTNGVWFNWNVQLIVPNSHFIHDGGTTITIVKDGLYQISVRYIYQCSTNGNGAANIDLYVTGKPIARVYHGTNNGYQTSNNLLEILHLKQHDTIMVKYMSNSAGVADQLGNTITIVLIG
jgi:hypothetical protein